MNISAIWLRNEANHLIVDVETPEGWVEVIKVQATLDQCEISHIVEEGGLHKAREGK